MAQSFLLKEILILYQACSLKSCRALYLYVPKRAEASPGPSFPLLLPLIAPIALTVAQAHHCYPVGEKAHACHCSPGGKKEEVRSGPVVTELTICQ
jgi:hypothetical protein